MKNDGKVQLVRAGHDKAPLLRKGAKEVEWLKPPGLAIGLDDGDVFARVNRIHEFEMESGDCLLIYTDGVTEAENLKEEQFGHERMVEVFSEAAPLGAEKIVRDMEQALHKFVSGVRQGDDITMIGSGEEIDRRQMLENIFKIIIAIALCSLVSCDKEKNGTLTDKDAIDSIEAKEKVTDCFNGYKESILAEDGDKAVKFLSSGTIDLYQKYVDLALDAEKDEIQKLSFINRMQAIFIRHRVAPDKLRLFDGREALVYGW